MLVSLPTGVAIKIDPESSTAKVLVYQQLSVSLKLNLFFSVPSAEYLIKTVNGKCNPIIG